MIPLYKTVAPPKVVYRVSRSADPRELPAWRDILRYERGRYDDPNDGYRVFYASSSPAGALTEALADLRPCYGQRSRIAVAEGERNEAGRMCRQLIAEALEAMRRRLAHRYISVVQIGAGASFVDLSTGASRSRIELELGSGRLKVGDFTGRDRILARSASRKVFEDGHAGLIAPSAEHSHARTVAVFETGRDSGSFRTQLDVLAVAPADGDHVAMMSALGALLRSDEFSPLIAS